jgi:predicted dehydrogenase/threonine dehydrogenase-like Zn-dependent dehydrogenase
MKQIAQNYRSGELTVLDVPPPTCAPGGVVVRSLYSLISTGTELMKVDESKMSLVGKARARPDQVKKVLDAVAQQGLRNAYQKAMTRLDSYTPLGYSLAGVVEEVGQGAEQFSLGQLVACAGNEFALHAERNWVPVNLCVPVPANVRPDLAAFAAVGAIALQGVRQSGTQLGDTACVIGLGLVGQLVVRLLVASGAQVVGLDMVRDRCRLAERGGALVCAAPDSGGLATVERALAEASGGLGSDRVFLTAGGPSSGPVQAAARLARDRAVVVDIGKCKLDLPWNAYYDKELELRFSRSYGPGRYDPRYELDGVDYPEGYVRWTERRNMACVLDLVSRHRLDLEPLVSGAFPVTEAAEVYERLRNGDLSGVGYLFTYAVPPETRDRLITRSNGSVARPGQQGRAAPVLPGTTASVADRAPVPARPVAGRPARLGFIGAGAYASSMLLPHLAGRPDVHLARVATTRSLSATNAQRRFGFAAATTEVEEVLSDESIDAVFVVTRHSSHAELTCQALAAGKAVFVEKPLALTAQQLDHVLETVRTSGNNRLMVGFNRRFAPLFTETRSRFGPASGPTVARYLVNAGPLAPGSWYGREDREGSRFAGEGGHFIDLISWWLGSQPHRVHAVAGGETSDLQVTLDYRDGSVATITYLTGGHPRFPKETFDASGGGRSARLENFKRASVWTGRRRRVRWSLGATDEGQRAQLDAMLSSLRAGTDMPIPLDSLAATTRATLAAEASLIAGEPVPL